MLKTVFFLQNAWSPLYAGGRWPRESWLRALHRSRSGRRLVVLTAQCPKIDIWFDNTTPIVGKGPSSVVKPDLDYMHDVLMRQRPVQIVAAGNQASAALDRLAITDVATLHIPHPANRVLTNDLYEYAGTLLAKGINGRIVLEQQRGTFTFAHTGISER